MTAFRFYFDFSCPYAYVASTEVEAMASRAGAEIDERPMLLGGVFRAHETPQNLSETLSPQKARHNLADMQRQAALAGVPLHMPAGHPIRTVEALRCLLAVGPPYLPLAHHFFRAYWVDGIDISTAQGLRTVLGRAGHDADAILSRIADPEIKAELRRRTDEAIETGVFGVPTFVVGDQLYWGVDRMPVVEAALGRESAQPPVQPRFPVDVYFDYSSPFSYVGTTLAERMFGDHARYRPMLLGAVFKQVGTANVPMFAQNAAKRAHTVDDMQRQAARAGLPFAFPSRFPMNTVLALRVTLLARAHETAAGRRLVHRIYRAYWAEDLDIADPDVIVALCEELELDGEALVEGARAPEAKQALRTTTDEAIAAGVFGAPTFVVHTDGGPELFWGADRIELAARAAAGDERVCQYTHSGARGDAPTATP